MKFKIPQHLSDSIEIPVVILKKTGNVPWNIIEEVCSGRMLNIVVTRPCSNPAGLHFVPTSLLHQKIYKSGIAV
jgi:hypothetical protein